MYFLSIPGYIITEDGLIPLTDSQKEDLIEEISEQYCDDNLVSGEQFYVMLRALVDCKLKEFPFDFDTFEEEIDD